MRFQTHNDKANNKKFLECTESFEKKEILKSLGFRWNPFAKAWQKEYTFLRNAEDAPEEDHPKNHIDFLRNKKKENKS